MRDILFKCPHCSKIHAIDSRASGRTCRCVDCMASIDIPAADKEFQCPACRHDLGTPKEIFGTTLSCPECNAMISVPSDESPVPRAPASPRAASTGIAAKDVRWFPNGKAIKLHCPACNQRLEVPVAVAGRRIPCPSCKGRIQLPSSPPEQPSGPISIGRQRSDAPPRTQADTTSADAD